MHLIQPNIRRDAVTRLQQQEIPWHQLAGIDLPTLTIAQHHCPRSQHMSYSCQGLLRSALLNKTDDTLKQHHSENH